MAHQRNNGFSIITPTARIDDWKAAYGLECIRIWREATAYKEATGEELDIYYPTEEEFREARKGFSKRTIYRFNKEVSEDGLV